MGNNVQVASSQLEAYAQRAEAAGGRIGGLELSDAAGQIGAALPGGQAGAAASGCALNRAIPDWGNAVAKQGDKVGAAEATYSENDRGNRDRLDALGGLEHGG